MRWIVNLLLALQLAGRSILALRECWRSDGSDRAILAALMLALTAGALAGL